MEEIKNSYKEKMKKIFPKQFEESEKTLDEIIEDRLEYIKNECSKTRALTISQFWQGQRRALEWIKEELKKRNDNK
jgi:hypothetical protein